MPELPEVEACRRLAERYCTGKRIKEAQVAEDNKVIEGIEASALQEALVGRTIKHAHRKGKQMWLEFDKQPCLMLHFGMTGSLVVKGVKSHQYKNFKVDESEWPPKYWKLALQLEGDVSIAFSDPRRFARIRLQEDPAVHEPVSLLGFDPVLSMPTLEQFSNLVKARKTSLKALLLDQAFSAGVGNWVADEVLYQAKLYPEVKASTLTSEEIDRLHQALKFVPETAVKAEADAEKFPQDWLFHVRWTAPKKNPKLLGHAVEFLKVGGRTTAYVPAVQKAPAEEDSSGKKTNCKRKAPPAADSEDLDEEEESADEAEEQPNSKAKSKGATAAVKRRKASAADTASAAAGEEEEQSADKIKDKPKAAAKSKGAVAPAKRKQSSGTKASDTAEEEEDQSADKAKDKPKATAKSTGAAAAARRKQSSGAKASDTAGEEEDESADIAKDKPEATAKAKGAAATVKRRQSSDAKASDSAGGEEDQSADEAGRKPKAKGQPRGAAAVNKHKQSSTAKAADPAGEEEDQSAGEAVQQPKAKARVKGSAASAALRKPSTAKAAKKAGGQ